MDIVVTGLVGFGGVLIGGALTAVFELWRRVLDGIAAGRLVRMELVDNRSMVEVALAGKKGVRLSDQAWRDQRLSLAPLLTEVELGRLWRDIGLTGHQQEIIEILEQQHGENPKPLSNELLEWKDALRERGRELRALEGKRKLALMWRLLRGQHLATDDKLQKAFGRPAGSTS